MVYHGIMVLPGALCRLGGTFRLLCPVSLSPALPGVVAIVSTLMITITSFSGQADDLFLQVIMQNDFVIFHFMWKSFPHRESTLTYWAID